MDSDRKKISGSPPSEVKKYLETDDISEKGSGSGDEYDSQDEWGSVSSQREEMMFEMDSDEEELDEKDGARLSPVSADESKGVKDSQGEAKTPAAQVSQSFVSLASQSKTR